ncbi:MAG: TolC family protein [Ignavibacteriaceae bacterium]|jgi:outer membrane protein TolC|nr:TolC family protein [Ignavibacteriaceae bacterium]MCW8813381.1 TolC family protein [Chlorobium sp.]MCW8995126.1 TolC family protein [Psychromonas sp.]MCW8817756.1 TolC family protein [Ignavibacteriaceae bacterium]MCW8824492.1 TolC family protein [Ignavibacteriaceae bacterium]
MKKGFLLFVLLSVFLLPGLANAQKKIYTLDEAINTALGNNRDINISVLNTEKSRAAVKEAFGYALPSLDASANFSHFLKKPLTAFPDFEALLTNATYNILFDENVIPKDESKFVPVETKLQSFVQSNTYSASLTLTQILFSSAVFEGIGASQTYYELAKSELNNTVSKTVLSVQKAFYGVLLAKAVLEITNSSFNNAEENFNNVKALYDEGMVSEFDKLQAEVQLENIRPVLLRVENALINATNGFKITLGIDQTADVDVSGEIKLDSIDISNEDELIQEALASNFDIKSLDLKKQVDEAFIQLDVSEYWPTLAAFGNYSYAGSSDQWNFQNYNYATVGLSFSINLWQGNRTKNAVEQSTITYKQTEEQLSQLKDYTVMNVKANVQELKRVQSLLEVQARTVKLAERAYDIAKVRYKEGAGSQLELQNADQDLRQARLNRVQAVHSYLITKFELDQLLGRTDPQYFSSFSDNEN